MGRLKNAEKRKSGIIVIALAFLVLLLGMSLLSRCYERESSSDSSVETPVEDIELDEANLII